MILFCFRSAALRRGLIVPLTTYFPEAGRLRNCCGFWMRFETTVDLNQLLRLTEERSKGTQSKRSVDHRRRNRRAGRPLARSQTVRLPLQKVTSR